MGEAGRPGVRSQRQPGSLHRTRPSLFQGMTLRQFLDHVWEAPAVVPGGSRAHDTAAWWRKGSRGLTPLCSSWLFLACSIWELSATLVNFSSSALCL